MGQVISRIVNILTGFQEKRLLLLGLDGAGKTSLLVQVSEPDVESHWMMLMNQGHFCTKKQHIGFNVERVEYRKMEMMIWDIGGQTKLRPLWRHYYVNTDALIYMVDSSDTNRIEEARDELFNVLKDANMSQCQTVLILLNKQDLPGAIGPSEMRDKFGLKDGAENPLIKRRWYIQACCAVTGEGVFEGLDWLCESLRNKKKVPVIKS